MSKKMKVRLQRAVSVATSLTTILWLSGFAMLAPMAAHAVTLKEGDIIRGPDGIKVYIINAYGFKRHIFNPAVFNMYGHLKWSNIKEVDQATLDSYTTSDLYRAWNDPAVYQTAQDGIKHWFNMTWDQFVASGYVANQVFIVNETERDYYSTGSQITYGGGEVGAAALTVSLASDTPASAVVPKNVARYPYTKVNLTAGSGADVTVTGLTVGRSGVAEDAAFSGVLLIDAADQTQIGTLTLSFDANHEAKFTDSFTIPKGTTKSVIFAGNMASSLSSYTGQVASLTLKAITTTATISGSLPLTGNGMTLTDNLTVGSLTAAIGSLDPGADATKNVGTDAYAFSSIKLTGGSVEDVTVTQFKFNQSGSAAAADLANVKVKIGTDEYATTVSSDGKYYNAVLGSGVVIPKGVNKEVTVYGDIVSGSARTITMDVYKATDIVVKGNLYGYNITVSGGSTGAASDGGFSSDNYPFFNGYDVTVSKGTLRVDKSSSVAAGNIAEGSTQVLGALDFVVLGEAIRISDLRVEIDQEVGDATNTTAADITLVTLYDKDGNAVLGPLDATASNSYGDADAADGSVRFQTALVVPVGTNTYTVKGKLSTDYTNNDTIKIGMNTPATRIASATGMVTSETVTATPATAVWGSIQTVKAGSLDLSVSSQPVSQSVVKGSPGFIFANFIFDGTASGEDIRVTSFKIQHLVSAAGSGNKVTNLTLWDGATALNTGSNVVSPTDTTNTTQEDTYTLDKTLVVPKNSIKTIALKGDLASSDTTDRTHRFGIDATPSVSATGVSTGSTITATATAANGQTMTVKGNGAFAVALDSGTHQGKLVYAGATGVEMTRLRFNATTESINLTDLRLKIGSASSTYDNLVKVYLYDTVGTKLAEAVATTTVQIVFSIPSGTFVIPKDGEKVMIVKADLANIGTGYGGVSGNIIAIDYAGTLYPHTKGYGSNSGATITCDTFFDTAQTNVYLYKAVPKFAKLALASNTLANGQQDVYKFKVTAQGGDIDLAKVTFSISTTSMSTEDFTLVDITEAGEVTLYASSTAAGVFGDRNVASDSTQIGQIFFLVSPGTGIQSAGGADAITGSSVSPRTVSSAVPRTFVVRLTNSAVATGDALSIQLEGDAAYNGTSGVCQTAANVDAWNSNDFIWSDRSSTSTHGVTYNEWTNGYLVDGLPSSNMASEVLSK